MSKLAAEYCVYGFRDGNRYIGYTDLGKASPMTDPRVPNLLLRDAIEEARWTYEGLANAVRRIAAENGETLLTNKSTVQHWLTGARPNERVCTYVVEALSRRTCRRITLTEIGLGSRREDLPIVSDNLIDSAAELGSLERRQFLATAAFTVAGVSAPLTYNHDSVARMLRARSFGAHVGVPEITIVRQITSAFRAADEVLGGAHGLTTVTTYLADTAAPMLAGRFASARLRRDAFGAVAELAFIAGFKFHDVGREGAAQRYYLLAFQLAYESDPYGHAAWMMRTLAHQALALKQPQHCVQLAEAGLARGVGHVDSSTESMLYITQARAFAAVKEPRKAARALIDAQDALARRGDDKPAYSMAIGPAAGNLASHTARTLEEIGDFKSAEAEHSKALARWNEGEFKRVHMLTHADIGQCRASQGRADAAVESWRSALDLFDGVASDRTLKAISSIRPTLAVYIRRGVPGARDLNRHVQETLARA